jgi:hypothetical protein
MTRSRVQRIGIPGESPENRAQRTLHSIHLARLFCLQEDPMHAIWSLNPTAPYWSILNRAVTIKPRDWMTRRETCLRAAARVPDAQGDPPKVQHRRYSDAQALPPAPRLANELPMSTHPVTSLFHG